MLYLGNTNSINSLELLLQTGLDWSVSAENLMTQNTGINSGHIAIVRQDNNAILGVHKDSYEIFQNQQMADLLLELSHQANLPLHSGGSLKGGAKVFMQLKTNDLNLGGDKIKGFLTAVNSFDGSTSLAFGNSTVTISCQNTFFMAYRQMDSKVKHTKGMQIKIDDLLRSVDQFKKDEVNHFDIIRKLASAPVTMQAIDKTYKTMFDVSFADAEAKNEAISTRKKNDIDRFNIALTTETSQKGATLWGLFSGVTSYTTRQEEKIDSKMFGNIANKERVLFANFAELVN